MKKFVLAVFSILILLSVPIVAKAAIDPDELLKIGSIGNEVVLVQQRLKELGYLNFRVTGKYSSITFEAVRHFQQNNHLPDDGQVGASTLAPLLSTDAKIASRNPEFKVIYGPHLQNPAVFGELTEWNEIDPIFPAGTKVSIQDLYSSNTFQMQRTGGINNARVETVSQSDTDAFTDMFGGGSTWEKRPVLATINGETYAASLFGAPGGEDTIADNGMNGGTQLFFYKSTSDLFSLRDEEHANSVLKAAGEIS